MSLLSHSLVTSHSCGETDALPHSLSGLDATSIVLSVLDNAAADGDEGAPQMVLFIPWRLLPFHCCWKGGAEVYIGVKTLKFASGSRI